MQLASELKNLETSVTYLREESINLLVSLEAKT